MKDIHDFFLICLFVVFFSALVFLVVGCSSFHFKSAETEISVEKLQNEV